MIQYADVARAPPSPLVRERPEPPAENPGSVRGRVHDLVVVASAVAAAGFVTVLSIGFRVTAVFVLAVILFAPGYAVLAALYPEKTYRAASARASDAPTSFSGVEWTALAIGVSVAIVPLVGLAINYSPWGLTRGVELVAYGGIVFLALAIAARRRRRASTPATNAERVDPPTQSRPRARASTSARLAAILVALACVGLVGAIDHATSLTKPEDRFTAFYVTDHGGGISNFTKFMKIRDRAQYEVHVANHEGVAVKYELSVRTEHGRWMQRDRNLTFVVDDEESVAQRVFDVPAGEPWRGTLTISPSLAGTHRVSIELYRDGNTDTPYRALQLWLKTAPEGAT